jgi:hypothetical protein
MPLSEEQQRLILTLARPLPRAMRDVFFARIGAELVNLPAIGDGSLYRLAVGIQRSLIDPPALDGSET